MISFESFSVMNFENAVRGARNPMASWAKSDSHYCHACPESIDASVACPFCDKSVCSIAGGFVIGKADMELLQKLTHSGTRDHCKFLREILVSVDITAPLYWWKEYDTYKVGTVANSTSTMHKIHSKQFELSDFSCDNLSTHGMSELTRCIEFLEKRRMNFNETNNKQAWYDIIELLPSCYNQMRTCTLNYEVLANIYRSRQNHKLQEWHTFCHWIKSLPYSELITD